MYSIWDNAGLVLIADRGVEDKILKLWESRNDKTRRSVSANSNPRPGKRLEPEVKVAHDRERRTSTAVSSEVAAQKKCPNSSRRK